MTASEVQGVQRNSAIELRENRHSADRLAELRPLSCLTAVTLHLLPQSLLARLRYNG